ncbi:MAG TPA: hypothetical protein VGR60_00485 [Gemmatimonadales bacterium]|nr:hypothetical protein [Gemmatimonadales bacterium]
MDRPVRALVAGALVAALTGGCALSPMLPPMSRADATFSPAPLPRTFRATPGDVAESIPVVTEYDSILDVTRTSVTTHHGLFFLWIRRPRLTFYYEHPGRRVTAPPATVEFVFRTQSPQDIVDNHLWFSCDGAPTTTTAVPAFSEVPSANTVTQFLVYRLPLADFAAIADCDSLSAAVGKVRAEFTGPQRAALRELAGTMSPSAKD